MYCQTDCKHWNGYECVSKEECARLHNDMYEKVDSRNSRQFFSGYKPSYYFRINTDNIE